MSCGGALGGIVCALIAPVIFADVLEYPLLLLTAVAWHNRDFALLDAPRLSLVARPIVFGALGVCALTLLMAPKLYGRQTFRSFFGVHKIFPSEDGRFVILAHGTTIHGAMRVRNDDGTPASGLPEPTTFYTFEGAIGSAIKSKRAANAGHLSSVAAVGLGAGSLSCHARPGEPWTFFEIDAVVWRVAQDPRYFRFLRDCGPKVRVVLGDARLTLAEDPTPKSILVIDAFSSDSIPIHLLTKEAIGMYVSKLDETGILIAHISSRHLEVSRVLARVGAEHALITYLNKDTKISSESQGRMRFPAIVAVLTRNPEHLGPISADPAWKRVEPEMARRPWTDDYSNIFEAILDRALPAQNSN